MKLLNKLFTLVVVVLIALSGIGNAQTTTKSKTSVNTRSSELIPLDPAIRTGKLANGFTYYIRKNTEPKNRVTLYLANKVGSILEDDDQR